MVGALHRDDALAERCVFLLQEIRKLLLGLRRSDDQDLMRAREGRCHFLEELRIGRMFMSAVRALAAMYLLMLIVGAHQRPFFFSGRELPHRGFLMIDPNHGMIVGHPGFPSWCALAPV